MVRNPEKLATKVQSIYKNLPRKPNNVELLTGYLALANVCRKYFTVDVGTPTKVLQDVGERLKENHQWQKQTKAYEKLRVTLNRNSSPHQGLSKLCAQMQREQKVESECQALYYTDNGANRVYVSANDNKDIKTLRKAYKGSTVSSAFPNFSNQSFATATICVVGGTVSNNPPDSGDTEPIEESLHAERRIVRYIHRHIDSTFVPDPNNLGGPQIPCLTCTLQLFPHSNPGPLYGSSAEGVNLLRLMPLDWEITENMEYKEVVKDLESHLDQMVGPNTYWSEKALYDTCTGTHYWQ
jgi:hypothetical protein